MNLAHSCIACGSENITKTFSTFNSFVSHLVMEYPMQRLLIGGVEIQPVLPTNTLHCNDCAMTFSQVRFGDEEMERMYSGYRGERYCAVRERYEPGYAALNGRIGNDPIEINSRANQMTQFISDAIIFSDVKTVLDYGGDRGQHIPPCFDGGLRYVYEPFDGTTMEGAVKLKSINTMTFDFVMCCNVLEHIPYPKQTLEIIKSACHAGTKIFIDVPLEAYNGGPWCWQEHINLFSVDGLQKLMKQSGFEVLKSGVVDLELGWSAPSKAIYFLAELVK